MGLIKTIGGATLFGYVSAAIPLLIAFYVIVSFHFDHYHFLNDIG